MDDIYNLYKSYGSRDYISENISQIEHALQCAEQAKKEEAPIEIVLAALLHDIGHLLGLAYPSTPSRKTMKIVKHEHLGADYLEGIGF